MIKINKKILLGDIWDELIFPLILNIIIILAAFFIVEYFN
jgi:hypothetical protein